MLYKKVVNVLHYCIIFRPPVKCMNTLPGSPLLKDLAAESKMFFSFRSSLSFNPNNFSFQHLSVIIVTVIKVLYDPAKIRIPNFSTTLNFHG